MTSTCCVGTDIPGVGFVHAANCAVRPSAVVPIGEDSGVLPEPLHSLLARADRHQKLFGQLLFAARDLAARNIRRSLRVRGTMPAHVSSAASQLKTLDQAGQILSGRLELVEHRAEVTLGFQFRAEARDRLGGANDQGAVLGKVFQDASIHPDLIRLVEVDGHIAAEDDIKRVGHRIRLKQVHCTESSQGADLIADSPAVAGYHEMPRELFRFQAAFQFQPVIFSVARLCHYSV